MTTELPLFPLDTVLYPGGVLGLRVFEPRYLDMVKRCTREEIGFGVLRLLPGNEHEAPGHAPVGSEARIVDFYTRDDGLLGLTVLGMRRFEVLATRRQADGLLIGQVAWRDETTVNSLPDRHEVLAALLEELIRRAGTDYPGADVDPRDAITLAWRLAELLPFEPDLRQRLLETDDPLDRLDQLLAVLEEQEDE